MGKFEVKTTEKGLSFNLLATNGQVVATSQVYKSLRSAKIGIASVAKNAPVAGVENQTVENFEKLSMPKFEVYTDKAGKTRFRLKAKNGQIIAVGEAYETQKACLAGVASVQKNAVDAKIVAAEAK
ncbi:MAG: YegP family protein [Kiritimatiellae bacterium]|nr:YegP family protein [Kiritimatiellia bacterium]